METKQPDRVNVNLLNALKTIPAKVSTHLKSHGRHYMILATAVCILAAYTVALTGCRSSTNPPKYSVEEMAREKHKSRSSGSR
jgi:hypothetical protein